MYEAESVFLKVRAMQDPQAMSGWLVINANFPKQRLAESAASAPTKFHG